MNEFLARFYLLVIPGRSAGANPESGFPGASQTKWIPGSGFAGPGMTKFGNGRHD
ncbi:MAG: hypothetical protein JSR56_13875 [Proteobacteria bacterium]|nr:hypothetical protein [Pseudomonadota bacterium]